jgi:D-tyrosyl-tRNA(Tyr) deacylase
VRLVIQRVLRASVKAENYVAEAGPGLLVFIGIEERDEEADVNYCAGKLLNMRIFSDEQGKMNRALPETGGEIMVVSQFTLHALTRKGNRPSFIRAARPEKAIPLYERFLKKIHELSGKKPVQGIFGADMQVELINDGPVTIILDSRSEE